MAIQTLLDPKENRIGNTVPWDGHCPFCGESTTNGRADCGWYGDTTGKMLGRQGIYKYDVEIMKVCKKVAAAPAPAATANPNGPHNNVVGAKYDRMGGKTGTHCPFCGKEAKGFIFPCGWSGQSDKPGGPIGTVLAVCKDTASGGPGPSIKLSQLAAAVAPAKPLINCPMCGAYAADKHRRGCKQRSI